jgi:hypothetical protein
VAKELVKDLLVHVVLLRLIAIIHVTVMVNVVKMMEHGEVR